MAKTIVMLVDSPLPRWDRAFVCLGELQAESTALWLNKNGIKAMIITAEEYFTWKDEDDSDKQT